MFVVWSLEPGESADLLADRPEERESTQVTLHLPVESSSTKFWSEEGSDTGTQIQVIMRGLQ